MFENKTGKEKNKIDWKKKEKEAKAWLVYLEIH